MALAETHRLKGLHIRLLKPPYKGFLYFSSYFFLHVQVTLRLRYLKFTHASLQVPSQKKKKKKYRGLKVCGYLRWRKKKKGGH